MNLHDWLLHHDAKHIGTQLSAVKSMWMMNRLNGAYYLANDDTDDVLPELIWALLPSEGWTIVVKGVK